MAQEEIVVDMDRGKKLARHLKNTAKPIHTKQKSSPVRDPRCKKLPSLSRSPDENKRRLKQQELMVKNKPKPPEEPVVEETGKGEDPQVWVARSAVTMKGLGKKIVVLNFEGEYAIAFSFEKTQRGEPSPLHAVSTVKLLEKYRPEE
jgi:hypothetical protein